MGSLFSLDVLKVGERVLARNLRLFVAGSEHVGVDSGLKFLVGSSSTSTLAFCSTISRNRIFAVAGGILRVGGCYESVGIFC